MCDEMPELKKQIEEKEKRITELYESLCAYTKGSPEYKKIEFALINKMWETLLAFNDWMEATGRFSGVDTYREHIGQHYDLANTCIENYDPDYEIHGKRSTLWRFFKSSFEQEYKRDGGEVNQTQFGFSSFREKKLRQIRKLINRYGDYTSEELKELLVEKFGIKKMDTIDKSLFFAGVRMDSIDWSYEDEDEDGEIKGKRNDCLNAEEGFFGDKSCSVEEKIEREEQKNDIFSAMETVYADVCSKPKTAHQQSLCADLFTRDLLEAGFLPMELEDCTFKSDKIIQWWKDRSSEAAHKWSTRLIRDAEIAKENGIEATHCSTIHTGWKKKLRAFFPDYKYDK